MRVLNLTCFLNYKMKQKKEKKTHRFLPSPAIRYMGHRVHVWVNEIYIIKNDSI